MRRLPPIPWPACPVLVVRRRAADGFFIRIFAEGFFAQLGPEPQCWGLCISDKT